MSGEYSVMIVGAAIVLIPSVDDSSVYQDLIDSMLLAQLAANKKKEKTPEIDWYNVYVEFLDKYWLRYSRARQDMSAAQLNTETVGDWVIATMFKDAVEARHPAAMTLQHLATLSGTEPAMVLLRRHMQKVSPVEPGDRLESTKAVRLLVVVAYTPASVNSFYLELETDRILGDNPLAEHFQAQDVPGNVCVRQACARLSETLYAPAREAIALKIKDRLEENVATLMLPGSAGQTCAAD